MRLVPGQPWTKHRACRSALVNKGLVEPADGCVRDIETAGLRSSGIGGLSIVDFRLSIRPDVAILVSSV
jgi:hypothetical protein